MKIKSIFIILLVLSLTSILLTGCNPKSKRPKSKIVFLYSGGTETVDIIQTMEKKFEKKFPQYSKLHKYLYVYY